MLGPCHITTNGVSEVESCYQKNLCGQGQCLLVCLLLLAQIIPSKNGIRKGKILENENMIIVVDHLIHGLELSVKGQIVNIIGFEGHMVLWQLLDLTIVV